MRKLHLPIVLLLLLTGIFVACTSKEVNKTQTNTPMKYQSINLYFSDPNAEYLVAEKREIKDVTPLKAIQSLIEGPKSKELKSLLPKELEVSNVLVQDSIAHVYIHESVPLDKHSNYGSSSVTTHIINSISSTLILNETFGIKKVKLEGDINDLLYGVETNELLDVNMSLIKEK